MTVLRSVFCCSVFLVFLEQINGDGDGVYQYDLLKITECKIIQIQRAHLSGGMTPKHAVCLECFRGDRDRRFVVNSQGGATHISKLSTAERITEIQLTYSDVELRVSVSQVTPYSHVERLAVIRDVII